MSLLAFVVVAFGFAGLAIVVRLRVGAVAAIGLVGLAAAVVAAVAIDPAQVVRIGETGVATTGYVRLFLLLGSLTGLGLAIAGTAAGTRRDAPAVTLAILGAAGLTLGLVDVRAAVLAATAGGLFGVLVTLVPRGARAGATVGILEARAVVVAGALAIAATAWFGRDLSQMAAQPVVSGLAYLAFAVAVAIRFGEIPFHLWAARLTDVVPETSLPVLTALAPASLALVALAWIDASVTPLAVDLDAERLIVLGIALASIVLAGVAATLQDDIEHVLGYSILQDAGVAVLAFASLDPGVVAAARNWLVASATVKTALAAWASVVRTTYGGHRLDDLGGWARHSPALGAAFAGILVAAIGLPNMALFQARTDLVESAMPGVGAVVALVIAAMPAIYLGRIAIAGLAPVSPAVAAGMSGRPRWRGGRAVGWSEGPVTQAIRAIPGELRANRAPLMALGVLVLAVMALLTATGGAGG
jgi:formate hydrogenlyase subunit 3/multisubunit Na+/H+ antiporter MnhD subunit